MVEKSHNFTQTNIIHKKIENYTYFMKYKKNY